jgi:hypothetical protein
MNGARVDRGCTDDLAPIGGPMAKTDKRVVVSSWIRNAREILEVSLVDSESCGHLVELRKLYRPLNGDAPREMERGTLVSLGVRHLPALVAAFTQADARARTRA